MFDEILSIIRDPNRTDWQKAADIHAAAISGQPQERPSAEKQTAPRKRGPRKARPEAVNGEADSHNDDPALAA